MIVRIATRRSPLAMWQASFVADQLQNLDPEITTEFVSLDTHADQRLDISISALGGKGAFSKEIQERVLAGQADIAVHSAKDLQAVTPDGLVIGAIPQRGEARDALVGSTLAGLGEGAVVATGSNRRRVQLAQIRPDLQFVGLRGNIGRRLEQVADFDAIVMAAVALERLDVQPGVVDVLPADTMIPQVGQGALAVECREDDAVMIELLTRIDHGPTNTIVSAERAFLVELGGDCDLPAGAHAHLEDGEIRISGVLANSDESVVAMATVTGSITDPIDPGRRLAVELRSRL